MIMAKALRMRPDGSMDVAQIFENYRRSGPPYFLSFELLMKIAPDPTLAGEVAGLSLKITNSSGNSFWHDAWLYEHPSLEEWTQGFTGFHTVSVQMTLRNPGEYAIDLYEGETLLASEGLKLIDSEEDSDAQFRGETH